MHNLLLYFVPEGDKQHPHQEAATITSLYCNVNIQIALWETLPSTLSETYDDSAMAIR